MDMHCLSFAMEGEYTMTAERLRKTGTRDRSGQMVNTYTKYPDPDGDVDCIAGSMATRSRRTVLSEVFRDGDHRYREWAYLLMDDKPLLSDRFQNIRDRKGTLLFDGQYHVTGLRPIMSLTNTVAQWEVWLERVADV